MCKSDSCLSALLIFANINIKKIKRVRDRMHELQWQEFLAFIQKRKIYFLHIFNSKRKKNFLNKENVFSFIFSLFEMLNAKKKILFIKN